MTYKNNTEKQLGKKIIDNSHRVCNCYVLNTYDDNK